MIAKMKKKGADKMISVYWFFIIALVAGGIVMMVNAYYGKPYDVRGMESKILAEKVSDCIYPGGKLNPSLISVNGIFKQEFSDNFLTRCGLNFDSGKEFEKEQYYVRVDFLGQENSKKSVFRIEEGNQNFVPDCTIAEGGKKIAVCQNETIWVNAPDNKVYFVKILTIVGNTKKNVK
jgi:hypothetical protein